MNDEHSAEKDAGPYVSTLGHRSNWRRAFCKWWGHEYMQVIDPVSVQLRLVCLRCYGGGNQPFRPNLTALTPSESRCTCGAGDHNPPGAHNIHCADPDASASVFPHPDRASDAGDLCCNGCARTEGT